MITPQQHIITELNKLADKSDSHHSRVQDENLQDAIMKIVFNKKYRKYSANDDLRKKALQAINLNITAKKPINIAFLHGAYKLWRLEEAPTVDWAELFALIYYTNWLKNICKIYPPGVHLDFFVDDYIIPELGTDSLENVNAYITSYQELMTFIRKYQPSNFNMTITPVGSFFPSQKIFKESLKKAIDLLNKDLPNTPPPIDKDKAKSIEFNTQTTEKQLQDPLWKEKIALTEKGYLTLKCGTNYHVRDDKILAFTQPLPSGTTISVGTTKRSIMKFWVGAGVLVKKNDHYSEDILSPSQLDKIDAKWQSINIPNITGESFKKIRIIEEFR